VKIDVDGKEETGDREGVRHDACKEYQMYIAVVIGIGHVGTGTCYDAAKLAKREGGYVVREKSKVAVAFFDGSSMQATDNAYDDEKNAIAAIPV
jgi:hypothetical protein